ncbi:MAG: flagellar basal body rod protein FlgC [Paracoccaceae bacterium]
MSDFSNALTASTHALRAQAARIRYISENISNADTPGYRRKMSTFETSLSGSGMELVRSGTMQLDRSDLREIYDPDHPLANSDGVFESSNVDLLIELSDAREARRSYEANLKLFEQTRQMSSSLMELLRK